MKKSRDILPVVAVDVFSYLAGKYTANNQLCCILRLNGKIDTVILDSAIRLSLDAEPILGCRFIEDDISAFWERRADLDKIVLLTIAETENQKHVPELQKFIVEPFDSAGDCQVKVKVFRNETDTICVKINHACSDAGGLKSYISLLGAIYNQLFNGGQCDSIFNPALRPGQEQIFNLPDIQKVINTLNIDPQSPPTVEFPCNQGLDKDQAFVSGKIEHRLFNALTDYAHQVNVSYNDLLLTAFNRAVSKIAKLQNNAISVNLTIDLRRYLPDQKAGGITNLSGGSFITINHNPADSFEDTLSKVVYETRKMKNDYPGLRSALMMERFAQINFKEAVNYFRQRRSQSIVSRQSIPYFSNVGIIADATIRFGLVEVTECYMLGPAMYAPGFLMLAGTYDKTTTLTVNFFQSTIPKNIVELFIDTMLNDLHYCVNNVYRT